MEHHCVNTVKVERTVLYGEAVHNNRPPQETLLSDNEPVISFSKTDGTGFGLNLKQLSRGLLLCGETGCGKTTVINHCAESIFRIMDEKDVCVILDVKGEFAQRYFDPNNENHIIFGSTGPYARYTSAWNIYGEVYAAAAAEVNEFSDFDQLLDTYAFDIAKNIFFGRAGTSQPFFCEAGQTLVAAALADHIRRGMREKNLKTLNNAKLVEFFNKATPQHYANLVASNPQLKNYLGEQDNNQRLGVLGTVASAINNSFVGPFAIGIGHRQSFTITDLMETRGGKILFVEMDLALAESLVPMYRLFFDYVMKSVLSMRNRGDGNVWVLFDELSTLPQLNSLALAMNLARAKGLKCIAALQSVSQLHIKYNEAEANSLLEGFTNIIAFRNSDKTTREMISRRAGSIYEHMFCRIDGYPMEREREGNAIEDWDILSLGTGEAYVMLSGYSPFRFWFPDYGKL